MDPQRQSDDGLNPRMDDSHIDELHVSQEDVHADAKVTGKTSTTDGSNIDSSTKL